MSYRNPFNQSLDWALQGKYARVDAGEKEYEGWVEIVHHGKGSIIMHNAVNTGTGEQLGSVFVRIADTVEVLKPKRRITDYNVHALRPYYLHEEDFTPDPEIVRRCYRNQFAGSFPVVREDGTIIDGHKRIAAAKAAGMERHPVEMIDVDDDVARELFQLAHAEDEDEEREEGGSGE